MNEREKRLRRVAFDAGWKAAEAFLAPETLHKVQHAWDEGFTACAHQHMRQKVDPGHYISRENPYGEPMAEWERDLLAEDS